jgi:hypothetical protein
MLGEIYQIEDAGRGCRVGQTRQARLFIFTFSPTLSLLSIILKLHFSTNSLSLLLKIAQTLTRLHQLITLLPGGMEQSRCGVFPNNMWGAIQASGRGNWGPACPHSPRIIQQGYYGSWAYGMLKPATPFSA